MTDTTVTKLIARQVWDSRGRPTVEAEVHVRGGAVGRAIAPAGASRGTNEATDLRDEDGVGVRRACARVNDIIARHLCGMDVRDQTAIDRQLIHLDGTETRSKLGGNAMTAVSLSVLHAAAGTSGLPVWTYLAGARTPYLPLPQVQIFGGGAHANRRIDIQDFMVMTPHASCVRHALEITARVYAAAGKLLAAAGRQWGTADEGGWWPYFDSNEQGLETLMRAIEHAGFTPGQDVFIALDVAASEFFEDGYYHMGLDGKTLGRDDLVELLTRWVERYPILSVEDPVAENDTVGMQGFIQAVGDRVQVVGDDYLVTNRDRIADAVADGACNAALLKVNQVGTASETYDALQSARNAGWGTIVSARSGETEDVTIAHLAVGWNAGQIKVGAMAHSERTAKWNELLRIEETAGAEFAGGSALPVWKHQQRPKADE